MLRALVPMVQDICIGMLLLSLMFSHLRRPGGVQQGDFSVPPVPGNIYIRECMQCLF